MRWFVGMFFFSYYFFYYTIFFTCIENRVKTNILSWFIFGTIQGRYCFCMIKGPVVIYYCSYYFLSMDNWINMEVFHRMFVHDSLINHVFIIKIFCFRINYFKKNWYILLFPLKLTDLLFHSFGHVTSINLQQKLRVRVMVFNATFCNISVISWQSVLLVEETWVPWENHHPVASHG